MPKRYRIILLLIVIVSLLAGCSGPTVVEKIKNTEETENTGTQSTVGDKSAADSGVPATSNETSPSNISTVFSEPAKPLLTLSPGTYGIENNISLENGVYDLIVKGSGVFSITDAEYYLVTEEKYPDDSPNKEYRYRVSLMEGYGITIGEGLTVDVCRVSFLNQEDVQTVYSGYWYVDQEILPGKYRVTVQNVYGENAAISIYSNGELTDTYSFVKYEDNDSYRDLSLSHGQVINIIGIQNAVLSKIPE